MTVIILKPSGCYVQLEEQQLTRQDEQKHMFIYANGTVSYNDKEIKNSSEIFKAKFAVKYPQANSIAIPYKDNEAWCHAVHWLQDKIKDLFNENVKLIDQLNNVKKGIQYRKEDAEFLIRAEELMDLADKYSRGEVTVQSLFHHFYATKIHHVQGYWFYIRKPYCQALEYDSKNQTFTPLFNSAETQLMIDNERWINAITTLCKAMLERLPDPALSL